MANHLCVNQQTKAANCFALESYHTAKPPPEGSGYALVVGIVCKMRFTIRCTGRNP